MTTKNRQRVKYRLSRAIIELTHVSSLILALSQDFAEHPANYLEALDYIYEQSELLGGMLINFWEQCFGELPDDLSTYAKLPESQADDATG